MTPDEVLDAGPRLVEQPSPEIVVITHTTHLEEQRSFAAAVCTCGWRSYARRSRPLARAEGRDHELLHATP